MPLIPISGTLRSAPKSIIDNSKNATEFNYTPFSNMVE
jgi:hypothetical protein